MKIILVSCNCSPETFSLTNTSYSWRTDENLIQNILEKAIPEKEALEKGILVEEYDEWREGVVTIPSEKYNREVIKEEDGSFKRWASYKSNIEEIFWIEEVDTNKPWTIISRLGKEHVKYINTPPLPNLCMTDLSYFYEPFHRCNDL